MRIELLAHDSNLAQRVLVAVPEQVIVRRVDRLSRYPPVDTLGSLVAGTASLLSRVISVEIARMYGSRLIICTRLTREVASWLARLTLPEPVWLGELDEQLPHRLRRLAMRDPSLSIAEMLLPSCGGDGTLRAAIDIVLLDADPPPSVASLAKRLHMAPSTLRARWRESDLPFGPHVLLDWARLVRVTRHATMESAARAEGISESTVYRLGIRRLGRGVSNVTTQDVVLAVRRAVGRTGDRNRE